MIGNSLQEVSNPFLIEVNMYRKLIKKEINKIIFGMLGLIMAICFPINSKLVLSFIFLFIIWLEWATK